MTPVPDRSIDRRPLTGSERDLIRRAENDPWSGLLRAALAVHVGNRGGYVARHTSVGDMVEWLEAVASSREGQA